MQKVKVVHQSFKATEAMQPFKQRMPEFPKRNPSTTKMDTTNPSGKSQNKRSTSKKIRINRQNASPEGAKENIFPPDYNKQSSPGITGTPIYLFIDLSVLDIDSIDEAKMHFSMQVYVREIWKDSRLNLTCLKPVAFINTDIPNEIVQELWTPNLVFENAKSGELFNVLVPNTFTAVLPNEALFRASRYNLIIGCYMNFMYYPIDVQECYLQISILANTEKRVILRWAHEDEQLKMFFKGVSFGNKIQSLKYELLPPRPYRTKERFNHAQVSSMSTFRAPWWCSCHGHRFGLMSGPSQPGSPSGDVLSDPCDSDDSGSEQPSCHQL
ncbi:gamma-aminobutyric acid receptor subunit rho-3 [Caerostris extrusa]|uniref:Gamma-aminobutyric acid receptor subunit rho-3 n=1 Tax=Caerostris extrusa TaxID=172846 RepID=A0AAV4Y437_CAEEX|nr:gamma-aminobutyric acid receptor subunit rho-3 [Caerostris extrusa]